MIEAQIFIGASAEKDQLDDRDADMLKFFHGSTTEDVQRVIKQLEMYVQAESINEHEPVAIRARYVKSLR